MTKPERVEVGMRFRGRETGTIYVIARVCDDACGLWNAPHVHYENGMNDAQASLLRDGGSYEYLAPAPATPGTATVTPDPKHPGKPGIGQIWRHHDFNGGCDYELTASGDRGGYPTWNIAKVDGTWTGYVSKSEVARSWTFIRYAGGKTVEVARSKPPASPVYGRMVGELRAPDGTPRTALEAIQAKREPEPWVPSCDIDCDIPDADEGWRR